MESIASLIASLGHDVGHPGLTNRYLITSRSQLAFRYNDISVLENMHCSMIYTILSEPQCNILEHISIEQWNSVRKLIIEMVLYTDMSKHFELLGRFRTRVSSLHDLNLDSVDDRLFILCIGLKCADIGHSAKTFSLHEEWSLLIMEEYFRQGDLEKQNKLPVSMYCDRETTDIPKSQNGFLKNVCQPLYEIFTTFLNSDIITYKCLEQMKENITKWDEISRNKQEKSLASDVEQFMVKVINRKDHEDDS
jgi:hypothetical protein